ncbi:riboflavin synthase [Candidatus Saganbacteria bacterium]|nr:riboflavin synthase [Candidatus Saganbacteria bacterium]
MFTGIIEEIGTVYLFVRKGNNASLSISQKRPFSDIEIGNSIAVNGVCLTVASINRNALTFDVSEESLRISNIYSLKIGSKVNLERALTLSTRIGGHIMTGHIDGIVEMKGKIAKDDGYEILFKTPDNLRKYIIEKGSVGLDGVSLTVAKLTQDGFMATIIPHTTKTTTLGQKQIGDKLNFEADVLAKYLEGLLHNDAPNQTEKVFLNAGFLPIGIIDN